METIIQVLWLILIFSSAIIYAYLVAYYVSKGYHRAKREEELKRAIEKCNVDYPEIE